MSIIVNPSTGQNIINISDSIDNQINIITQDANNLNLLSDFTGQNIINVSGSIDNQINIIAQNANNINVLPNNPTDTNHNSLTNIQGGGGNQNNEYYHLALDQYNGLAAFTLTEEYLEFPDGSIQTTAFNNSGLNNFINSGLNNFINSGLLNNFINSGLNSGLNNFINSGIFFNSGGNAVSGANTFSGVTTFVNTNPYPYNPDEVGPSIVIENAAAFQYDILYSGSQYPNGYARFGPNTLYTLHQQVQNQESYITTSTNSINSLTTNANNAVYITGNQNISGIKTFLTGINISGNITISGVYDIYQEIEKTKILAIAYAIAL